jgi:hypothetical protein
MTWNDPIIEEVRKVRDAHAKKFNYDLKAIYLDLKQREQGSGRRYVSLAPRKLDTKATHDNQSMNTAGFPCDR